MNKYILRSTLLTDAPNLVSRLINQRSKKTRLEAIELFSHHYPGVPCSAMLAVLNQRTPIEIDERRRIVIFYH